MDWGSRSRTAPGWLRNQASTWSCRKSRWRPTTKLGGIGSPTDSRFRTVFTEARKTRAICEMSRVSTFVTVEGCDGPERYRVGPHRDYRKTFGFRAGFSAAGNRSDGKAHLPDRNQSGTEVPAAACAGRSGA